MFFALPQITQNIPNTGDAPELIFDGTVDGFWLDAYPISNFRGLFDTVDLPSAYGQQWGRWVDRSGNNRDVIETNAAEVGYTTQDGSFYYGVHYNAKPIAGCGGASTAFYFCWTGLIPNYYGTLFSDVNTANTGFSIRRNPDNGTTDLFFSAGTGSARVEVSAAADVTPAYSSWDAPHTIEAFWDGTIISLRVDRQAAVTAACATVSPGLTTMTLGALDAANTDPCDLRTYQAVYVKNKVISQATRDAVYDYMAATAGLGGSTTPVFADGAQTYAAWEGVAGDAPVQGYAAFSGVQADAAQSYVSRETVVQDGAQSYSAVAGLFAELAQTYAAGGSLTAEAAQSYLARAAVAADGAQTYAATQGVNADGPQTYAAFEGVFAVAVQVYAAGAGVTAEKDQAYSASSQVQAEAPQGYSAAQGVFAEAPQNYAGFADALTVTADGPQSYGAAAGVSADAQQDYAAFEGVTAQVAANYAAFEGVSADRAQVYAAFAAVQVDMTQIYAAMQGVFAERGQSYQAVLTDGFVVSDERAALLYQLALLHGLDAANPMSTPKGNGTRRAGGVVQTIAGTSNAAGIETTQTVGFSGSLNNWIDALAAEIGLMAPVIITPSGLTAGTLELNFSESSTEITVSRVA